MQSSAPGVRFTTTVDAFYIIAIERPTDSTFTIEGPVPVKQGDTMTMLGGSGEALTWRSTDSGIEIDIDQDELDSVSFAWAFKIAYS
jgi:alpha-L-fucosidase